MIAVYLPIDGRMERRELAPGEAPPSGAIWVDLVEPTREEEREVERVFGIEVPTREEMQEIEVSSRLYTENETHYLTSPVLSYSDTPNPLSTAVTFILTRSTLVTLRYAQPKPFAIFGARLLRQPHLANSSDAALSGLLDAVVDRLADVLEYVVAELEHLSAAVFSPHHNGRRPASARKQYKDLRTILRGIGRSGDLIAKARESLMGLSRLLTFALQIEQPWVSKENHGRLRGLMGDVRSLTEHAAFISSNITFLLDATLGLVNLEQNNIIKIFSVAAVAFLPPTLIASLYGMNFKHMPELDWPYGYAWALGLMICSAALPLLYFKKRGWL